jgi:hypothetical protein
MRLKARVFKLTDGRLLSAKAIKRLQFFSPEMYLVTTLSYRLVKNISITEGLFFFCLKFLIPVENFKTYEKHFICVPFKQLS